MKNLIKSKVFIATFLLTYLSFFVVTMWLFEITRDGFGVGHAEYGYPFGYYYSSCFGGYYLWSGLIGNILFAFVLSFAVGIISSHYWLKFSSPEFRQKWYLKF